MQEVAEDPYARQVLTVRELKKWQDNYVCRYKGLVKEDLW